MTSSPYIPRIPSRFYSGQKLWLFTSALYEQSSLFEYFHIIFQAQIIQKRYKKLQEIQNKYP